MNPILADDLTGAAEIAAVLFRYGFQPRIFSGDPSDLTELEMAEGDFLVFNSDSRTLPAKEASKRIQDLLARIPNPLYFKKIDSLLRGRILEEIQAILEKRDWHRILLLPQNPSLGRTVSQGIYRVNGEPLENTLLAGDPDYPARFSEVNELLKLPPGEVVFLEPSTTREFPDSGSLYFAQAETMDEVSQYPPLLDAETLPVGGSDFFQAILHHREPDREGAPLPHGPPLPPVSLYVSGSAHPVSREYFRSLEKEGLFTAAIPGDEAMANPEVWDTAREQLLPRLSLSEPVVLRLEEPLLASPEASRTLAGRLGALAADLVELHPPGHLYVEGGTTAGHVFQSCGWNQFEVAKVWNKGAVTLRCLNPASFELPYITLKPSSFPWPEAFATQADLTPS